MMAPRFQIYIWHAMHVDSMIILAAHVQTFLSIQKPLIINMIFALSINFIPFLLVQTLLKLVPPNLMLNMDHFPILMAILTHAL